MYVGLVDVSSFGEGAMIRTSSKHGPGLGNRDDQERTESCSVENGVGVIGLLGLELRSGAIFALQMPFRWVGEAGIYIS